MRRRLRAPKNPGPSRCRPPSRPWPISHLDRATHAEKSASSAPNPITFLESIGLHGGTMRSNSRSPDRGSWVILANGSRQRCGLPSRNGFEGPRRRGAVLHRFFSNSRPPLSAARIHKNRRQQACRVQCAAGPAAKALSSLCQMAARAVFPATSFRCVRELRRQFPSRFLFLP